MILQCSSTFVGSLLLFLLGAEGAAPSTIEQIPRAEALMLRWHDAEDNLSGRIAPPRLRATVPVTVSMRIEPFSGPSLLSGPVTLTLRKVAFSPERDIQPIASENIDGDDPGIVVPMTKQSDGSYAATVAANGAGPHVLQVTFRTSRQKIANTTIRFESAPLPVWPWAILAVLVLVGTLGVAIARQVRHANAPLKTERESNERPET
jgi:hypothetical protein